MKKPDEPSGARSKTQVVGVAENPTRLPISPEEVDRLGVQDLAEKHGVQPMDPKDIDSVVARIVASE